MRARAIFIEKRGAFERGAECFHIVWAHAESREGTLANVQAGKGYHEVVRWRPRESSVGDVGLLHQKFERKGPRVVGANECGDGIVMLLVARDGRRVAA